MVASCTDLSGDDVLRTQLSRNDGNDHGVVYDGMFPEELDV